MPAETHLPQGLKRSSTQIHNLLQCTRRGRVNCPLLELAEEDIAMQTRVLGTTMPVLEVQLEPNESVFSESGELSWMTASIQMTTHTQMGGGGGIFGVLKRVAAGASIFMTEYRAVSVSRRRFFCDKGARPHCAGRTGPGPRISGPPSRLPLRHTAGNDQPRFPAVARRGHLRRRRIPAAETERRGHGMA